MPEGFEELRQSLLTDVSQLTWDHPADVRRRGAQRARHRLAVTWLAVIVTLGGGAGTAVLADSQDNPRPEPAASASHTHGSPDPAPPSRSPSASPTDPQLRPEPTVAIPDRAMLQPGDVGHGHRAYPGRGLEDSRLEWMFSAVCGDDGWADTSPFGKGNRRIIDKPGNGSESWIGQIAERHRPGEGADYMTGVIEATDRCKEMTTSDGVRIDLKFDDHDFAGDASFLVREEYHESDEVAYFAFVRQGDLVSQLIIQGKGATKEHARTLAKHAAKRLCHATPSC